MPDPSIDEIAQQIAGPLGAAWSYRIPEAGGGSRDTREGDDVEGVFRILDGDGRRILLASLPPDYGVSQSRLERIRGENGGMAMVAQETARTLNRIAGSILESKRTLAEGVTCVVHLREGWHEPHLVRHALEHDMGYIEKFVVETGRGLARGLDRIPSLGRVWQTIPPHRAGWISSVRGEDTGILRTIDLDLGGGPGLTLLSGGNRTGKTFLLGGIESAMTGRDSPLSVRADLVPYRAAGRASAPGMARFRNVMGYGDERGELFMPIVFEGHSAQKLERIGQAMVACAEQPGSWPGLMLDVPLTGLDETNAVRMSHLVATLARERQIVVTTRGKGDANLFAMAAECAGVKAETADLNAGEAIVRRTTPEPVVAPRSP